MSTRVSFDTAAKAAKDNPNGKWPGRAEVNRIEPECWPQVAAPFQFERGDQIFTIGSCFARNVEEYLAGMGFRIPTMSFALPPEEALHPRPNGALNKYTPAAIYQELAWARAIDLRDGVVTWADIEPLLLETGDDAWLDLHLAVHAPVTRKRALERRQQVFEVARTAFTADAVIITPGVLEAWFDTAHQLYVQQAPSPRQARKDGGTRFVFERLSHAATLDLLRRTVDLLDPQRQRKIVITVSPVPMGRTFTRDDVIVANTHAKATLRSAVGELCAERENIAYFPSYETVTLTRQSYVWEDDLVHVAGQFVGQVVSRMAQRFVRDAEAAGLGTAQSVTAFIDEAKVKKRPVEAIRIYEALTPEAVRSVRVPEFHNVAAKLFSGAGRFEIAELHVQLLRALLPDRPGPFVASGHVALARGEIERARSLFEKAMSFPMKPKLRAAVEKALLGVPAAPAAAHRG